MKLKQLNTLYQYKNFPLYLLNKKRPKWSRLQKVISKKLRSQIYDYSKIALSSSRNRGWNKLSLTYRRKLLTRRLIKYYLSQTIKSFNSTKKIRNDLQKEHIFKYLFTLNNLLRYSYQTHNENYSKSKLFEKIIFLNDSKSAITQSFILSKGDLISTQSFQNNIQENFEKYLKGSKFYPFFQYDPYVQNIILLKSASELSKYDIALSVTEFIELEKLT